MNDQNLNSPEVKNINYLVRIIFTLILIAFIASFWFVFYSDSIANTSQAIFLRNWYQNTTWDVRSFFQKPVSYYPPFDPIYVIQVQGVYPDGSYLYNFFGKFNNLDVKRKVLSLEGPDHAIYNFSLVGNLESISDTEVEFSLTEIGGTNHIGQDRKYTVGLDDKNPLTFLKDNNFIRVVWRDNRTLNQIHNDLKTQSSMPLNTGEAAITKYN